MKTCKLCVHTKSTFNQDIVISSKEIPDIKAGDVFELYHPDDEWNRILLQVKCLPEEFQQKDAVSIEQGIANAFSLRPYNNIVINKVDPKNVALDLVEMLFKEQYLARGDMWRLCKTMMNSCVYMKKTVEFAEMRATVNELWAGGENVTCGVITDDTRIVFRSPTAVVQIFIQMSAEMWDFDLHGDLYFEKAVNGFLTDLFDKWKEQNCVHDVTIVLFSRTFYDAQSLEEFPPSVRECLQLDSKGRIYEDFYRVIVQNERYEEWTSVLRQLRRLFSMYQETVVLYHSQGQGGWKMPKAHNSPASQGNFLETLNMSLNLYEKYYADRNFDRTGKVSVVITPGPGVFEVDRQLANITKQRTIDCGIGSDLVCMGEKPLHAAPLFKFHSKSTHKSIEVGDDYNIPHWINHSFYMSKNQIENHMNWSFVPRIKPPPELLKQLEEGNLEKKNLLPSRKDDINDDNIPFVDYDEYDAQVFKLPSGTMPRSFSTRGTGLTTYNSRAQHLPKTWKEAKARLKPRQRHISDEVSAYMNDHPKPAKDTSSPAISIPSPGASQDDMSYSFGCYPIHERAVSRGSYESSENDELVHLKPVVGSAGSPVGHSRNLHNYRPHRALINPFAPSRLQFKMTSNRRRWVHAFPVDQKGMQMQARHVHSVSHTDHEDDFPWASKEAVASPAVTLTMKKGKNRPVVNYWEGGEPSSQGSDYPISESPVSRFEMPRLRGSDAGLTPGRQKRTNLFGSAKKDQSQTSFSQTNYAQDWSFDMSTAVDWKSLTIPASLPVTTDYFPDRRSLTYDYVVSEYELLPEDDNAEIWASWSRTPSYEDKTLLVYRRAPLKLHDVFLELISQRLGKGFQLITKKKPRTGPKVIVAQGFRRAPLQVDEEYYMSIGRIYHKVTLIDQKVKVTRYRPRHPSPQLNYEYRYRFRAPDSFSYDVSWTNFANEQLENYNWNHLDQYICTGGDLDFGLIDSLRYWRSRFLLLPLSNPATKRIIDRESARCDIYEHKSPSELQALVAGFIKFLETMNKLKRPSTQQRKSKVDQAASKDISGDASPRKAEGDQGAKDKEEKLNINSSSAKIAEALSDPINGLILINQQVGLPLNTFISAEAVAWCMANVARVDTHSQSTGLMQRLMDDQYVVHDSGNPRHKFIYGFYLYYLPHRMLAKTGHPGELSTQPATHITTPGTNYNSLFQNEWCEVTVLPVHPSKVDSTPDPAVDPPLQDEGPPSPSEGPRKASDSMLVPELEDWRDLTGQNRQCWDQQTGNQHSHVMGGRKLNEYYKATLLHKYANVDVDHSRKSERKEFAMARYHAYYSPKCAFELQLHWMVATGTIMGDLVYAFSRRASSCGFHLMPVPCDPFALPYTENSDPLRGPIFVPLDMKAFDDNIFEDCSNEKRQELLYMIQDDIVKRFGFLPVSVKVPPNPGHREVSSPGQRENYNHQYVHCTAGMFVLVPESNPAPPPFPLPAGSLHHLGLSVSPQAGMHVRKSPANLHKFYIARQGRPEAVPNEVGFLWSWNYMSSRRWRTSNTGDEKFQDTMLADFRQFCSNDEGRLTEFWDRFKSQNSAEKIILS